MRVRRPKERSCVRCVDIIAIISTDAALACVCGSTDTRTSAILPWQPAVLRPQTEQQRCRSKTIDNSMTLSPPYQYLKKIGLFLAFPVFSENELLTH